MAALKWLVGVMGVLIVAGTVALAVVLVQRLGGEGGSAGSAGPRHLGQPAGTRILSVAATSGGLAVLVARPEGGERVLLVDPRSGRVTGELRASE